MYIQRPERPGPAQSSSADPPDDSSGSLSLEEMEKLHIEKILRKNNYSRSKTAGDLGISKKTLYLKIKRFGMKVAD